MKKLALPKGRKRNTVTLLLCVLLAVLLLAINLLLPYLQRKNNQYIDITPERLYTLSDAMKREVSSLQTDVEILFLQEEDRLLDNAMMRYVYIMCRKLSDQNPHITVRTESLAKNPTVADAFKTTKGTSLTATDVVVHSKERYSVLSGASFFGSENDAFVTFNGEYRIATAILSVTTYSEGMYAYYATGHGERYYLPDDAGSDPSLSAFTEMLSGLGMTVGKLNLDEVAEVPDNCVMLVFCGTQTDYDSGNIYEYGSPSPLKKLDKYLNKSKAMMVLRDAYDEPLPNFDDYLAEWGIGFTDTHVTSAEHSLADSVSGEKNGDRLVAAYPTEDTETPTYTMIRDIISMTTPPKTVIAGASAIKCTYLDNYFALGSTTSRTTCPLFFAGEDAKATDKNGYTVPAADGRHILALLGMESQKDAASTEYVFSYVFAAGSTQMISNDYLADAAFGNADTMHAVLRTICRTDVFASTEVGGFDLNSDNYGGKWFEDKHLSATGVNEIAYSKTEFADFAQLTPGRMVWTAIGIFLVPVLTPLVAVMILRRRKSR